jgi:TolB-like protein/DNA-binding winged helix-turn-helix (wHTH) protein/Flp pilus assembly protein TadD
LLYSFEDFSLDTARRELRRGGMLTALQPQVFDLLEYVIRNRERVVSKDDLLGAVWNGRIVSESTLSTRINAARNAIGDSGEEQRLIRTAHGKGIRFVGAVREGEEETVRKLAAIFAADVAGYSRLMGEDEVGTLRRLTACRALLDERIAAHRGRIFGSAGDSVVADFASAVDAVQCAVAVQEALAKEEQMRFRIGVHVGDVIVQGENLFGDGVNIAARLEALAEPGGICISRVVRDQIRDRLPYAFEDLGEQSVKNIARPVRVYAMSAGGLTSLPRAVATPGAIKPVALSTAPRLSIVVLPFANLSSDPDQEYFADGITDDLTTDLARISGSFVIARNTAFTYRGKAVDVKQIGRELGVRYVLEGSVRRASDQVRVNVQLIDAESGAHVWADRFETDRRNLVEAQGEITGRLAQTLNIELVRDVGRRIEREKAVNPDAQDLVMRGWALYHRPRSAAATQEAQRAFEQALEIDPRSVDARVGIAAVLLVNLVGNFAPRPKSSLARDTARAEQLLLDAIESDPNNSAAHSNMGLLRRVQIRLTEARIEFEVAISLGANDNYTHGQLAWTLLFLGQPRAGLVRAEKILRLSPRDPSIWGAYLILGWCQLLLNEGELATELLIKSRAANPRPWVTHFGLAAALALIGDLEGAKAALAESLQLNPEVDSLARFRAYRPWGNPQYWALFEKTAATGTRQAGFPDQ